MTIIGKWNIESKKIQRNSFSGCVQNNGKSYLPERIIASLNGAFISTHVVSVEEKGLRDPQYGALCAILSHWTLSQGPATIVMPTGTGKTETVLATIIAAQIKRTLIVVPTNYLRSQMFEKARFWGVLYSTNNLSINAKPPNTLALEHGISDLKLFKDCIQMSNIVISTMALASKMSKEHVDVLRASCDLIVIDEAHHVSANTWSDFKSKFTGTKLLQFTATPYRNDGKKVDGKIIYNFPLHKAQQQGYFQEIEFEPIEEINETLADNAIAERAIKLLELDLSKGYDHIILVRAATIKRASELFSNIYNKRYGEYNPVLITSEYSQKKNTEAKSKIENRESRIIVCVDMFGEGVDIPNLKISAIHDKYRSLPITLQFIGRFARAKQGLGRAKIVTNIADRKIIDALDDLYQKDTDWNYLLPKKANRFINREIEIQDIASRFIGTAKDVVDFSMIRPKVSMVAYDVQGDKWKWENWVQVFDESKCTYMINENDHVLIVVEPQESSVDWTTQQNMHDLSWEVYLVFWNPELGIAFLNSTDRSKGYQLVQAIWSNKGITINGEKVFRCLHGINRLALATVGLNSALDGPVRYKMFAGIDVAQGITEANKSNNAKSNLFGLGYENGDRVSIGCSYKGVVWARWIETIDYWMSWCNHTINKIIDSTINTSDILSGVLIPEEISKFPDSTPYRVDFPNELLFSVESSFRLKNAFGTFDLSELAIEIDHENTSKEVIVFDISNPSFTEKFEYSISGNKHVIRSIADCKSSLVFHGRDEKSLEMFLIENPPTFWFVDGSSVQGTTQLKISGQAGRHFDRGKIRTWDWKSRNVDIRKESQFDSHSRQKHLDSIQYALIQELKSTNLYKFIFDDDSSGEIADVIAIKEAEESIDVELYHCKFSSEEYPGSRILDLYEVCGQTEKSIHWKSKPIDLINRMIQRESSRLDTNTVSRIELGTNSDLQQLRHRFQQLKPVRFTVTIVQPGVKASAISEGMERLLTATQSYCQDTFAIPVYLLCSN